MQFTTMLHKLMISEELNEAPFHVWILQRVKKKKNVSTIWLSPFFKQTTLAQLQQLSLSASNIPTILYAK